MAVRGVDPGADRQFFGAGRDHRLHRADIGRRHRELAETEAELAKLFCNAWRYINFAIANDADVADGSPPTFSAKELTVLPGAGVTITDSLETPAVRKNASDAQVAQRTAGAGTDLLLYVHCDAGMRAARALRRGLAEGKLKRAQFEASVDRVLALRGSL